MVTRFLPLALYETEPVIEAICESYRQTLAMEVIDPLILIPTFICDFLCIHPFNDGNGRMSRLLTLLLLYQNGYEVGKYISIEKQIEKTKDAYYDVLSGSCCRLSQRKPFCGVGGVKTAHRGRLNRKMRYWTGNLLCEKRCDRTIIMCPESRFFVQ